MKKISFLLLFFSILVSCNYENNDEPDFVKLGLKPVYGDSLIIQQIKLTDTIEMEHPGKIVFLAPRLFVNEINRGIHVLNYSNPELPFKEAFIQIPFNKDLAVKNNIIYADNDRDLISIRYFSKDSIQLIDRKKNVFDHLPAFPQDYWGYFECVDESKGVVVDWIEVELRNPQCRTF